MFYITSIFTENNQHIQNW